MKSALIVLSSFLVAVGAFAQGQVNFAARVVGVYDAPVFLGPGGVGVGAKAEGPAYMAQLYAGATQASLAPVGAALPFRTGAAAGYWTAEARTINTVDASGNAFVQVRAWITSVGATYEAFSAAGGFGESNVFTVKPTTAPRRAGDIDRPHQLLDIPDPRAVLHAFGGFGWFGPVAASTQVV